MYVYVCVLYRSKDATEEMEALVKAQNNPDEIELDEEGDEEEAMVQGEVKGGKRDNADALRGEKKGVTRVIVPNSPLNCSREVGGVCVDVAVALSCPPQRWHLRNRPSPRQCLGESQKRKQLKC